MWLNIGRTTQFIQSLLTFIYTWLTLHNMIYIMSKTWFLILYMINNMTYIHGLQHVLHKVIFLWQQRKYDLYIPDIYELNNLLCQKGLVNMKY